AASGKIKVFAREVVSLSNYEKSNLPWLIFFQGGPGFQSPRPMAKNGWIRRAVAQYRVLLLDQRGTGKSSPITYQTLAHLQSPQEQAEYLKHFRADSIVNDAERIRLQLAGKERKWLGLGQSYGGFCLTHYLSAYPDSLDGVLITGGIPPVGVAVDDVYRSTYKRCLKKNLQYRKRYPGDADILDRLVAFLQSSEVKFPGGGRLSVERLQQLGISFGMSDGFELVHYLLEDAFIYGKAKELSFSFLKRLEQIQSSFETNPLYVLLHEAIYCECAASSWSAQRVRDEFQEFDANGHDKGFFFTGEMVYPWMFDQYEYLAPLKGCADILAAFDKWPILYDTDRLKSNKVPTVACVYHEDMYVEREYSENLADTMGNTKLWVTNEYEHNGLRADGYRLLDRLLDMMDGEI
ncbi:MAG: alpha/beta hydrolase, partial [Candidatus Obscuribacterales bacterium]|nr:alpha/beta hydrolase [Candidatus Obscuribacterales bacterium]